jgi:deoxyribose-phosphate aldolase
MTPAELAGKLDLTVLRPDVTSADVHRAATAAMHNGLRALVAAPAWTGRLATMLHGSGVRIVSVVGFPFGGSKSTVKAIEATSTIKDGADEIEVVAHLPYLLGFDLDGARAELMEIVRAARSTRRDVTIRAIVELAALMRLPFAHRPRAFEFACRAVRESGCDGIVTATGFYADNDVHPVDLMVGIRPFAEALTIKAAVINDAPTAAAALAAGAERIGAAELTDLLQRESEVAPTEATR